MNNQIGNFGKDLAPAFFNNYCCTHNLESMKSRMDSRLNLLRCSNCVSNDIFVTQTSPDNATNTKN